MNFEGVPASHKTEEMFEKDDEEIEQERMSNTGRNYRTTGRSVIESGEFDEVTVDPTFKNDPIKRQILITLGSNNQQTPNVKNLVTWLMGRKYWKNQLNVQTICQTHRETPQWKVVLNNVINPFEWYPEENQLTGGRQETTFLTKTHLKWNLFGNTKEMTVKIVSGSPFDFTNEMREHKILTPDNLPEATAQKYKYTLEIEVPQVSQRTTQYMQVLHDIIKNQFYHKLTTVIPTTPYHNNKFIVSGEFLPEWEEMNVIVKTPREESYISSVPFHWNPFQSRTYRTGLHDAPMWNWFSKNTESERESTKMGSTETESTKWDSYKKDVPYTTSKLTSNTCSLSPTHIRTFDGITLPLNTDYTQLLKGCTTVLAQDCGGSLFSITGDGDHKNGELKILLPDLDVKLVLSGDKIRTIINGEEKVIHTGEPCMIPPESSKTQYKIEKTTEGVIELKSYQLGLTLNVDKKSKTTHIKLSHSSMLQGQVCGICGNYNQDQSDDVTVPWDFNYETRDFHDVIKKSVVPSDTCNVGGLKSSNDDTCQKEGHLTISRDEQGTEMTCTSVKKYPQCSQNCRPHGYKTTKVCFTCSNRNPQSSITTPRKSYKPPTWDIFTEGGEECEDFYQRMEVPTRCVPVY